MADEFEYPPGHSLVSVKSANEYRSTWVWTCECGKTGKATNNYSTGNLHTRATYLHKIHVLKFRV